MLVWTRFAATGKQHSRVDSSTAFRSRASGLDQRVKGRAYRTNIRPGARKWPSVSTLGKLFLWFRPITGPDLLYRTKFTAWMMLILVNTRFVSFSVRWR